MQNLEGQFKLIIRFSITCIYIFLPLVGCVKKIRTLKTIDGKSLFSKLMLMVLELHHQWQLRSNNSGFL